MRGMRTRAVIALAAAVLAVAAPARAEVAYVVGAPDARTPSGTGLAGALDGTTVVVARDNGTVVRRFPHAGTAPSLSRGAALVAWQATDARGRTSIAVVRVSDGARIATFAHGRAPVISPDGARVAFLPEGRRGGSLFLGNVATGAITSIRGEPAGRVSWAPDSSWFAFDLRAERRSGRSDIFRASADGQALVQLTQGGRSSSPAVSPDGRTIAYVDVAPSPRRQCVGAAALAILPSAGGAGAVLSRDRFRCPVRGYATPAWAGGERLVAALAGVVSGEVVTQGARGGVVQRLTRLGTVRGFSVSADGRTVLFQTGGAALGARAALWAVGVDGKGLRLVRRDATEPAFAPS